MNHKTHKTFTNKKIRMIIKKHPKIAILMAVYNGMLFIEDQINSILAQKMFN